MLAKVQPAQTISPFSSSVGWKITHSFILKWEKWDTFQETFHCALSYNQTAQTNLKITNLLKVPTFCKHFMDENCRKALHVAAMPSPSGTITLWLLVTSYQQLYQQQQQYYHPAIGNPRDAPPPPLPVTPDTPYITREWGQVPSDHQLILVVLVLYHAICEEPLTIPLILVYCSCHVRILQHKCTTCVKRTLMAEKHWQST